MIDGEVITDPIRIAEALYEAEWMLNSITAYIGVLLFSFTLALNYLILHPDTGVLARLWSSQEPVADTQP